MRCDEFRKLIDSFIDGELDPSTTRAMRDHAQICEVCADELKFAEMLRDTLGSMDDTIVPPLSAQAAWRGAIKAETRKRSMRRIYRFCGSVAAALVLTIGCFVGFRVFDGNTGDTAFPGTGDNQQTVFVASDGAGSTHGITRDAAPSAAGLAPVSASVKLQAEKPLAACETIKSIADEFNGETGESEGSDSSAYITAYIPAQYVEEFISSLDLAGLVSSSEIEGEDSSIAVITITVKQE